MNNLCTLTKQYFFRCVHSFCILLYLVVGRWTEADDATRRLHIMRLLNATDVSNHDRRMEAVRALLYIAQGT